MPKLPKKTPSGNISGSGRDYAKSRGIGVGRVRGLTDSDVGTLIEVEADNTEQVIRAINQAKARALEKIGLVAEGYAKKLCPVDTGRLRNSITHVVDIGFDSVYIGTNVEYGPYVELGTARRQQKDAQPFLRPAAQNHASKYRAILKAELQSGGSGD